MTINTPWPDCPRCSGVKMGAFLKGIPNRPVWRCMVCGYERERQSGEGVGELPPTDAERLVELRAAHEAGDLYPAAPEIDLLLRIIDGQKLELTLLRISNPLGLCGRHVAFIRVDKPCPMCELDEAQGKLHNIETAHMHYEPNMRGCSVCRILGIPQR